jgi:hypothetical protein
MVCAMAKEERIAVRLDAATKAGLAKAAQEDKRSLSSMVQKIIADWLKPRKEMQRE